MGSLKYSWCVRIKTAHFHLCLVGRVTVKQLRNLWIQRLPFPHCKPVTFTFCVKPPHRKNQKITKYQTFLLQSNDVTLSGENRYVKILLVKHEGNRSFGIPKCRWEDNIEIGRKHKTIEQHARDPYLYSVVQGHFRPFQSNHNDQNYQVKIATEKN